MGLTRWLSPLLASAGLMLSCAGTPDVDLEGRAVATFLYDAELLPGALGTSPDDALAGLQAHFEKAGFEVLEVDRAGGPTQTAEVRVAVPLGQHIRSPRDVAGLALWAPPQGLSAEEVDRLEAELMREMTARRAAGEVISPLTDVNSWIELPESARAVCVWLPVHPAEARHWEETGLDQSGMDPRFVLVEAPRNKARWLTGPSFRRLALTPDHLGNPAIEFAMTEAVSAQFLELTESLIGQLLYVAVDGRIITAPRVQAAIPGMGIVSGGSDGLDLEHRTSMLSALPGRRAPASSALLAVEWE